MPQSLIQLPSTAKFMIGGWIVEIRNHKIVNSLGLFGVIVSIIRDSDSDRKSGADKNIAEQILASIMPDSNSDIRTLYEFEEYGISWEMAVEQCVTELEEDALIFARIIAHGHFNVLDSFTEKIPYTVVENNWVRLKNFSKSVTGRAVVDQLVEKIRSCENWEELYDEMQMTSRFQRDIKSKMADEIKKQATGENKQ